jgi:hypothetical protein
MQSYNGYTPQERMKKSRALVDAWLSGRVQEPWPPCQLCGDPDVTCDSHSEDYSEPHKWRPPAMYSLCGACHARLHKRFTRPDLWEDFKAHVRRGGYARDLREDAAVIREFGAYRKARARGAHVELSQLRPRRTKSKGWWDKLSVDLKILTARSARPRR